MYITTVLFEEMQRAKKDGEWRSCPTSTEESGPEELGLGTSTSYIYGRRNDFVLGWVMKDQIGRLRNVEHTFLCPMLALVVKMRKTR